MRAINALPTPQITKKNASPTTIGASQVRQDASAPHPRSTPREITWIVNAEKAVPNAAWMGLYGIRGYLTVGALAAAGESRYRTSDIGSTAWPLGGRSTQELRPRSAVSYKRWLGRYSRGARLNPNCHRFQAPAAVNSAPKTRPDQRSDPGNGTSVNWMPTVRIPSTRARTRNTGLSLEAIGFIAT